MGAIRFFLNGRSRDIDARPDATVLELLRGPLALPGTKEGCGEGDCGACTVVLGELDGGRARYRPATSCLLLAPTLEGRHLITIEGLAEEGRLHPVQQALLDANAVQCGYCTPGVVMSLFALFLEDPDPDVESLRAALEGNLCRCTGYVAIRDAGAALARALKTRAIAPAALRPSYLGDVEASMMQEGPGATFTLEAPGCRYVAPRTAKEVTALLARHGAEATLLSGGTDVVVAMRVRGARPPLLVDLSRVRALQEVSIGSREVVVGAAARLEDVGRAVRSALPVLADAVRVMCSRQVRSQATLVGNVANASPVADTVPVLMALGARLRVVGPSGGRDVPLDRFYRAYKDVDRRPDEWIASVTIPCPEGSFVNFEKASRRRELDISAVNSAILLRLDDAGRVTEARVAFGGAAPTARVSGRAAAALVGREFTAETARAAGRAAALDVSPIGDVRGGADYRRTLVENLVVAHWRAFVRERGGAVRGEEA